jgi:hypothetical protein
MHGSANRGTAHYQKAFNLSDIFGENARKIKIDYKKFEDEEDIKTNLASKRNLLDSKSKNDLKSPKKSTKLPKTTSKEIEGSPKPERPLSSTSRKGTKKSSKNKKKRSKSKSKSKLKSKASLKDKSVDDLTKDRLFPLNSPEKSIEKPVEEPIEEHPAEEDDQNDTKKKRRSKRKNDREERRKNRHKSD